MRWLYAFTFISSSRYYGWLINGQASINIDIDCIRFVISSTMPYFFKRCIRMQPFSWLTQPIRCNNVFLISISGTHVFSSSNYFSFHGQSWFCGDLGCSVWSFCLIVVASSLNAINVTQNLTKAEAVYTLQGKHSDDCGPDFDPFDAIQHKAHLSCTRGDLDDAVAYSFEDD